MNNFEQTLENRMLNLQLKEAYLKDPIIVELFEKDLDIYDSNARYLEMGVPNVYCKKHFDDEDFIYAKLKFNCSSNSENVMNEMVSAVSTDDIPDNYLEYITKNSIFIDFTIINVDIEHLYGKVLYIYQFIKTYYQSLSHLRPVERVYHLQRDILIWIDNIVDAFRYILDKDLFNFRNDGELTEEHFNELIYGLNLIICHIKMITNHYRINHLTLHQMEEKHIKKLFRITNNMCIVFIFLNKKSTL